MRLPRRRFLANLPVLPLASATLPLSAAATLPLSAAAGEARPNASQPLRQRLRAALEQVECFDTHEHIRPESERLSRRFDFFTLASHYVQNDLASAGMPRAAIDIMEGRDSSEAERWRAFEPHWKNARLTGYGRALRIAVAEIYGFRDISAATLPAINRAIASKNRPGFTRHLLRERARIRTAVQDDAWNLTPVPPEYDFFRLARKLDPFFLLTARPDIEQAEKISGQSIASLRDLKRAMEANFEKNLAAGMVTVKTTAAYHRELLFEEVEESDADRDFQALIKQAAAPARPFQLRFKRPFRRLEDHMFHHMLQLARAHAVPVQVHTGLHAQNFNVITNSRPTLLTNLFFLYPDVRFDLFHASYPYQSELAVQAKMFRNVFVDLCWVHVISPMVARRALAEFLETVPVNKIFGFGGDYRFAELSYAHARMARDNIAELLAELVERRDLTETEALEVGRMLLHDNAAAFFERKQA